MSRQRIQISNSFEWNCQAKHFMQKHHPILPSSGKAFVSTEEKYAIIGAGPSGLGTARCFLEHGIPFDGFEAHSDVGGLWNIANPVSTVYQTAHLISSKKMTEFAHFPMPDHVADFPHHSDLCEYFQSYAKAFGLYQHYHFNTRIDQVKRKEAGWLVSLQNGLSHLYKGVIIANGTLSHPNWPTYPGEFSGEMLHAAAYKSPSIFKDKRVLIVGAGNSGCDIAVDAIHQARAVHLSVRRGYHFIPKYILGKPADTMGGKIKLPPRLKQKVDKALLKLFVPDPVQFGFPEPDHRLYESHPIVNHLILHHLGHGDMEVKPDIEQFEGEGVHFVDGSSEAYDLVLFATGYQLHYPFLDKAHLNWQGDAPRLYLNIFHPRYNDLFVIGLLEATGLGWQGRYEQAELVARFIQRHAANTRKVNRFIRKKAHRMPDTTGGIRYLPLARMAYYVHKDTYRSLLRKTMRKLG